MKEIKLPNLFQRAQIKPSSYDVETNSIEVVASTGAKVRRFPFFSDPFIEKLDMSEDAVDLARFNEGAPLLMNHSAFDVREQLGVIESASLVGGELRARIRFSSREEFKPLIADIKDGIVRNVSIGYVVHQMNELDERENGMTVRVATKWEPFELSFVTIPADGKSGTRSQATSEHVCHLIERDDNMSEKTSEETKDVVEAAPVEEVVEQTRQPEFSVEEIQAETRKNEALRFSEIHEACKLADVASDRAADFYTKGLAVDDVRKILLSEISKQENEVETLSVEVGENNERAGSLEGLERSILNRIDSRKYDLQSGDVRGSLIDIARESIALKGDSTRGMNATEVASRALHASSDFPLLLQNVVNKTLRAAYEEAPATWGAFTRSTTVTDFKEINRLQIGDFSKLLPKNENGEYVAGTTSESSEKYTMQEYGRSIRIGRRLLINDDTSAFDRLPAMMGRQARNLEADVVVGELVANKNMSDGNALFSLAHNNLLTGQSLDIAALTAARAAMRLQRSLGGSLLNLRPEWMYVPVALETAADQISSQITPNESGQVNPFSSRGSTPLLAYTDPRLDDDSATTWYLMANVADIDMMEIAYLAGETVPFTDQMMDFDTDGMKMKIRHTFGVKAIDWRGMLKVTA